MVSLFKWIAILCVALIGYDSLAMWKTGRHVWESPPPPKTDKQLISEGKQIESEEQIEYLAGIIRHAFRGDDLERLLVGLAAENTKKLLKTDYKTVFRKAAEQVPPWSSKSLYVRVLAVVMALGTEGERSGARSLARQIATGKFEEPFASLLKDLPSEKKCVTTYFRPEGNKNAQTDEDLAFMRAWKPKAHESKDGAFWICLPDKRPE